MVPERAGYWLFAAHLFAIFSIAASNILLGLLVLSLPWALRLIPWEQRRHLPWPELAPLYIPLAFYVIWLAGSVLASFDPWESVSGLREIFTLVALFLAPLLVRGEKDVRRIVDGLILASTLFACAGLTQYLFGYGDIDRRIRGPFSHYMTFSGILLVADFLVFAALLEGKSGWARRGAAPWQWGWRWVALLVLNGALLGSYTRSAWVGLGVVLTLLLLIRAPRFLLLYVPAAILFVILAPVPLIHRVASITDLRDLSNYDRLCMVQAGLTMVAERPLFGQGPELVERRYPIYRPPTAPRWDVPHLHNTFLQLAAERGLPALAAYLGITAAGLALAWRRYLAEGGRSGPRADLYLGTILALLAFNLAGLFENNWGDTEVQRPVLFMLALPFCLALGDSEGMKDGKDSSDESALD
jgi:putative inorganic carbon (HCO3(-)) transporter